MSEPHVQSEMAEGPSHISGTKRSPALGYIVFFLGVAMVAYGVTALWFGMRDVMDVGGYCAEGGPYVIQQTCPDGAELLMLTGIPVGIIGLFVALVGGSMAAKGAGALLLIGWPALFVSLGYNFIDYAINPPENMGSTVGWWICGIIFALMGLPALVGVPFIAKAIQPDRRTIILVLFVLAAALGVALGIWVDSRID